MWELARWPRPFEVVVTAGNPRPHGITVHRCAIARADLTVQRGIRVTTAPRTLLDCARCLMDEDLTRAVNDARHRRLSNPSAIAELLDRYPHHPGAARLQPFAQANAPLTLSTMEDRFARLCRDYGLPTPQFNAMVCGYMVDALFAPQCLIVELDSWEFHQDRSAFETDRLRDAVTLAAGYATLRITWQRPDEVEARRIARILAMRRP